MGWWEGAADGPAADGGCGDACGLLIGKSVLEGMSAFVEAIMFEGFDAEMAGGQKDKAMRSDLGEGDVC